MVDYCSLDDVKAWLGETTTTKDAVISRLCQAVTTAIDQHLGTGLLATTYTEKRDGNGGARMGTKNIPITAVTSVTVNGAAIAAGSVTAPGFYFDDRFIILNGYSFVRGFGNVTLTYMAGLSAVPRDVQQAAILTVQANMGSQARDGSIQSYSVPGVFSESYVPVGAILIPDAARELLSSYVRYGLI